MSVDTPTYLALSAVMFLEYAIWGAWAPVLAARLLGPLKMTGKQTGWIYATLPLACMISPLVAGQLADKWMNMEYILAACHLIGAVLLFIAARTDLFKPLFLVMLIYAFFYAATMPLVNAVLFTKVSDGETLGKVFVWAPVAWALVGYFLTGWRWKFKTEGHGRDGLYLAAVLSVFMGIVCLFLPTTPPAATGEIPIVKALAMLGDPNFLIFIIVSMAVTGLMQFYFLGTAQFIQDRGIPGKNVPATMGIAQAIQAIATLLALGWMLQHLDFKNTLLVGMGCWLAMYLVYALTQSKAWLVLSQGLHGLAYVFFIIVGQIFANGLVEKEILSSMQGLVFFATTGIGLFFGTQAAGYAMDRFNVDGKFQWRGIWMVPVVTLVVAILALALLFQNPVAAG